MSPSAGRGRGLIGRRSQDVSSMERPPTDGKVDTTLRACFIHGTSALPPAHRIPAKQPGPGSGTMRGKYSTCTRGRKRGDSGSAKRRFERQTKTWVQQSSITTAEDSHDAGLLDAPSRRLPPMGRHQWLCRHKTPEQARDALEGT
ncbi:hypothetical protein MAPG_03039 [Magnaporthiopsis poae ATCC 64411]|uniref:Uncharacterized protein n=1 Tax=Magnaporthiopsis poae (strain ATCC 64411 / 73-15) TaxID=644358 RepID=A0A0C4CSD2_MAGP6|nr:hypothetical protein, variant [Magnaporthiopsis poae ATCC 64411]KLU83991.1 hypothetical protein MAPG_03039 [Magnaporthiopsis poae ATCC 64411]